MVFLFFPSMASLARSLFETSFFIFSNKSLGLPIVARLKNIVVVQLWLATEILPIVSVVALSFVVLFVKRTPLGLEIEHVKIFIFLHKVYDSRFDISNGVSKGTKLAILTLAQLLGELSAKLSFVLFKMVESFHPVM